MPYDRNNMPAVGDLVRRIDAGGGLTDNFPVGRDYFVVDALGGAIHVEGINGERVAFLAKRFEKSPHDPPPNGLRRMPNLGDLVRGNDGVRRVVGQDHRRNAVTLQNVAGDNFMRIHFWRTEAYDGVRPVIWPFSLDGVYLPPANYNVGQFVQRRLQLGHNRTVQIGEWVRIKTAVLDGGVFEVETLQPRLNAQAARLVDYGPPQDQPPTPEWAARVLEELARRPPPNIPDDAPAPPPEPWPIGAEVKVKEEFNHHGQLPEFLRPRGINGNDDSFYIFDHRAIVKSIRVVNRWGGRSEWLSTKWFELAAGDLVKAVQDLPNGERRCPPPKWEDTNWAERTPSYEDGVCAYGHINSDGTISGVEYSHCHSSFISPLHRKNTEYVWTVIDRPVPQRWLDYIFGPGSPWKRMREYIGYFQSPDKKITVWWLHRGFIEKGDDISNQLIMTWIKSSRIYTEALNCGELNDELFKDEKIHPGVAMYLSNSAGLGANNRIIDKSGGWHGSFIQSHYNLDTLVNFINGKEKERGNYLNAGSAQWFGCDKIFNEGKQTMLPSMLTPFDANLFKTELKPGRFGKVEVSNFNLGGLQNVARLISEKIGYGVDQ